MLSLIATAALLAACGTDGGGDPIGASAASDTTTSLEPIQAASTVETPTAETPTAGTSPTETAADGSAHRPPAFPEDTAPQTRRGSGKAKLVLTDVRVADHERFDRIVLEFSGTGAPGWAVNYVDEATLDGSGDVVTLGGEAILDIYASGTTWPAPDYYNGPQRLEAEHGGVTDVHVAGTFEGYTQVLAGIDGGPVPFRVFSLTGPSRLVVDVVDEGVD